MRADSKQCPVQIGTRSGRDISAIERKADNAPILGMLQDGGTYYLDTDASDVGLGAVLSQDYSSTGSDRLSTVTIDIGPALTDGIRHQLSLQILPINYAYDSPYNSLSQSLL